MALHPVSHIGVDKIPIVALTVAVRSMLDDRRRTLSSAQQIEEELRRYPRRGWKVILQGDAPTARGIR
jgi:hypothetical protein